MRTTFGLILIFLGFLLFFAKSMRAQVSFVGDSVKIETPTPTGMIDYQVILQNADNISESVYYWSDSGTGTFHAPYCNVRVSRTAYDSLLIAHSEFSVELKKVDISVKVSAMPNRKILVEVQGGNFDILTRHVSYSGAYMMYEGNQQYYPKALNLAPGQHILYLPYRIKGQQGAIVTVHAPGCSQNLGRIFYLN